MDSLPWSWIFWGVIALIAIKLLLRHTLVLRDHLRSLLVGHLKKEVEQARKRQNIQRLQAKIRRRHEIAEAERIARESDQEDPPAELKVRRAA